MDERTTEAVEGMIAAVGEFNAAVVDELVAQRDELKRLSLKQRVAMIESDRLVSDAAERGALKGVAAVVCLLVFAGLLVALVAG